MTVTAHVYEVFIRALRERVWHALVDPGEGTSQGAGNNPQLGSLRFAHELGPEAFEHFRSISTRTSCSTWNATNSSTSGDSSTPVETLPPRFKTPPTIDQPSPATHAITTAQPATKSST